MNTSDKDTENRLQVQSLTKLYPDGGGVRDVDLSLAGESIFGLLGPNGAGKSTFLYLVLGLISPDHGDVRLHGHDVFCHPENAKQKVGVLLEEPAFYPNRSAVENLLAFHVHRPDVRRADARKAIKRAGLDPDDTASVRTYSSGMRQRLGLARAIAGTPDLLLLDEPTSNLDPEGCERMMDVFDRIRTEEHVTILYCTHRIEEVRQLCDRVGILKEGRLQTTFDWPPEERGSEPTTYRIVLDADETTVERTLTSTDVSYSWTSSKRNRIDVNADLQELQTVLKKLLQQNIPLQEVRPNPPEILRIYKNIDNK